MLSEEEKKARIAASKLKWIKNNLDKMAVYNRGYYHRRVQNDLAFVEQKREYARERARQIAAAKPTILIETTEHRSVIKPKLCLGETPSPRKPQHMPTRGRPRTLMI